MEQLKTRLSSQLYDSLIKAQINTLKSILVHNKTELAELTRLSISDAEMIIEESAFILLGNKLFTANRIPHWQRISTGCPSIDKVTNGGFPVQGITEIVGASGVGKTQLCLQLSLMVQLPPKLGGLGKSVVYICTEDVFPIKRSTELSRTFRFKDNQANFQDNIFIHHVADFEQLKGCLFDKMLKLLTVKEIGLVVIDSIAGVFRSANFEVSYVNRSQDFVSLVSKLNKLSSKHGFMVVCVNQVSDNIDTGKTEACLGLAWSNLVTSRFGINRHLQSQIREFEVIFSPDLPNRTCSIRVVEEGVIDA